MSEEAERLFQSEGWKAYEQQLAGTRPKREGAEARDRGHFVQQMESRRRSIAEQQERIATAQSGQAGLVGKKTTLTDELSRLKAERPGLAADLAEKKTELDSRAKEIDAKRVEAMAEDKGVEGTLKEGKGPIYRERMGELGKLQEYYKIGDERVRDAQKRLSTGRYAHRADRARAGRRRRRPRQAEGRGADGRAAHQGDRAIASSARRAEGRSGPRARGLRAGARRVPPGSDRRAPGRAASAVHPALRRHVSTPATKDRVRDIDCDPKQAGEAAARVFALNAGIATFAPTLRRRRQAADTGGIDALLSFGRKCLHDCGLPSRDSNEMGARLSAIDLNRDDKAHHFVVTWNAFQDGNRLAYLALALAIGDRQPDLHVGPVRRQCRALAAVRPRGPQPAHRHQLKAPSTASW